MIIQLILMWLAWQTYRNEKLRREDPAEWWRQKAAFHRKNAELLRRHGAPADAAIQDRLAAEADAEARRAATPISGPTDLLRFVSLLAPPAAPVAGFFSSSAWYTIWNGRAWLNARKLSPGEAEDWHVTQLEAMGLRQTAQTLATISLWRWNGKTWTRVA